MTEADTTVLARRYSMVIQWSERDQVYVVSLPEWEAQRGLIGHTHGATYAEAVRMGEEMLALLVDNALANGEALPAPQVYASAS